MEDKILQVKEKMKRISNTKNLTKLERYDLTKKQCENLNKKELDLLVKECQRDYKAFESIESLKEGGTILLTGIGLFITSSGDYGQEANMSVLRDVSLGVIILIYVIAALFLLIWVLAYSIVNKKITSFMIDVLEECIEDRQEK